LRGDDHRAEGYARQQAEAATKEQAQNFTVRWVEENPVALGACLKTGEVAEGKS
jgi:hypothetical protein